MVSPCGKNSTHMYCFQIFFWGGGEGCGRIRIMKSAVVTHHNAMMKIIAFDSILFPQL